MKEDTIIAWLVVVTIFILAILFISFVENHKQTLTHKQTFVESQGIGGYYIVDEKVYTPFDTELPQCMDIKHIPNNTIIYQTRR